MIKTIRVDIPFSDTKSMKESLAESLAKFGLSIAQITLPNGIKSRTPYQVESHYGNWCYVPALDIPELHNTDLRLDMPQSILELKDVENLKVGDRVSYRYANMLAGQSVNTGRIFQIKFDEDTRMAMITVTKGKSKSKGFRFYTGDCCMIEKL